MMQKSIIRAKTLSHSNVRLSDTSKWHLKPSKNCHFNSHFF